MILHSIRTSPKCVSIFYYQQPGSLTSFLGPQVKRRSNALWFSTKRWETSKIEDNGSQVAHSQAELASGDGILSVKRKKTMAELDAELREKLEGLSGDGGREESRPICFALYNSKPRRRI
jgi:hypothetical protein